MDDQASMMSNSTLTKEQMEEIWARRAALMAQVEAAPQGGEQVLAVVIRLGRELLALDVQYVTDIRAREAVTRIPRAPAWLTGVINLRGRILSVIDLRQYLDLPADSSNAQGGYLVVAENKDMEVVFLVDDVPAVEILPMCEKAQESILHGLRPEYVAGIAERQILQSTNRFKKQHVTLINGDALLSDPHLIVHQETV